MTDLEELGRRATACKGWKWLPGMLIRDNGSGIRYLWQDVDYSHGVVNEGEAWVRLRKGGREYVPDLTDAATLGCLLQLVRGAWGDPEAHLALGAAGWVLMSGESRVADVAYPSLAGRTEAEALVAALEASS